MPYYSILAVTPTNEDWIPNYIEPANALVAEHGGKYLARTASHERLEGDWRPTPRCASSSSGLRRRRLSPS